MPSIAAVVVTYNRKDLLLECLSCLQAQDFSNAPQQNATLDILVIDNASTDNTHEALQFLIEDKAIRYYNTGSNLGGAGGFNYGMRKAVELGYDYVWVMDDDCMPHDDTLFEFLNADAELQGNYGYLSSVCRWIDGSICTMNTQRHPLTKNVTDFSPKIQPITLASFVSLFVPSRIIKELGLPIKDFFIWSDDWEFTRRISRKYPCYLAGKSVVTHKSKSNGVGNIALDSEEKIGRYRLAYRNDIVFYRREGLKGYGYIFVRGLYHAFLVLTKAKSKKGQRLKTILRGNLEGLRFHPDIEYINS
ncbi:MAG: glycosyltransferase family 2 protein [Eggerthellaceae bacterium]